MSSVSKPRRHRRHRQGHDAGGVAGLHVHELGLETAAFRPAVIHAVEDVGPVIRLGAARARLDGEDRVVAVELAGEERADLDLVELGDHRVHLRGEFGAELVFFLGGTGLDEFDHHVEIGDAFAEIDHG